MIAAQYGNMDFPNHALGGDELLNQRSQIDLCLVSKWAPLP